MYDLPADIANRAGMNQPFTRRFTGQGNAQGAPRRVRKACVGKGGNWLIAILPGCGEATDDCFGQWGQGAIAQTVVGGEKNDAIGVGQ